MDDSIYFFIYEGDSEWYSELLEYYESIQQKGETPSAKINREMAAYSLQLKVVQCSISKIQKLRRFILENWISEKRIHIIMERSMDETLEIFLPMQKEKINSILYDHLFLSGKYYSELFNNISQEYIFLKCANIDIIKKRYEVRNQKNKHSMHISEEYFLFLENMYQKFFEKQNCKTILVDENSTIEGNVKELFSHITFSENEKN